MANGLPGFLDGVDSRFLESTNRRSLFGTYTPVMHGGMDLSSIFGQGMGGQAANLALLPYLTQMMGGAGMVPGQFQPVQNMFDYRLAQQMALAQRQAMEPGRAADEEQMRRMMRGALGVFQPGPVSMAQGQMIDRMASGATGLLPLMAMMHPQMVDSLFGSRGSASVMGQGFAQGGMLLADSSGYTGLSGQASGLLAQDVFRQLYGPGARVSEMRGLGGAATGQLFAEMSRRGLVGELERDEGGGGGGLGGAAAGRFRSGQITQKLKDMAGVVSAMRDIFGDMNKHDAPMNELIQGLEMLTQGGLATMSRPQIESLVRRTQQMAKLSGVGMDAVFTMQAASAQRLDAMGLDRTMAADVVNSSLAYATAYGQVGGADSPGWRKMSKEKIMSLDQRLREQAAGSDLANQLGTLARLGEQGLLQGGSPAEKMFKAIQSGDTSALAYMNPGDFVKMLEGSGVSAGAANAAMMQTGANQEYIQKYRIGDRVRSMQWDTDMKPLLQDMAFQGASAVLGGKGITGQAGTALGSKLGTAAIAALHGMSSGVRDKESSRNAAVVAALRGSLTPAELASLGPNEAEQNKALQEMAVTIWGGLEENFRNTPYEGARNVFGVNDPRTQAQSARVAAQAEARARVSSALSGLGQAGPLKRLIDALGETDERGMSDPGKKDLRKLAAAFLGGVDKEDVLRELVGTSDKPGVFYQLAQQTSHLEQLGKDLEAVYAGGGTPAEKEARAEGIRKKMRASETVLRTLTEGTSMVDAEDLAKSEGVTLDELLRGKRDDGTALDPAKVATARSKAGAEATSRALGVSPEASKAAHEKKLADMLKESAPSRKADLEQLSSDRKALIAQARAKGMFKGKKDEELTAEDIEAAAEKARKGELGAEGTELTGKDSAIGALASSGIGVDEYLGALRDEDRKEEAKTTNVRIDGRLTIEDDRTGTITGTGTGVSAPSA